MRICIYAIQPFPKFPKDRLSFAPVSLHAILPTLSRLFIHPSALGQDGHALLKNPLALDTLFVGKFSAAVLKEHMNLLLPRTWRQCDAVQVGYIYMCGYVCECMCVTLSWDRRLAELLFLSVVVGA